MADRTHKTRQKMTFRSAAPSPVRPRNPLVAPAMKRVAGAHRKSGGAVRTAERQALKRAVTTDDD